MTKPPPPPRIPAQRALDLLSDPAFTKDLDLAYAAVRVTAAGHQAPEHLTPEQFYERYGILPVRADPGTMDRLQKPGAPHREAEAILGGRWGVLRVFPWTTDAEIRAGGKRVRRALQQAGAKEHRDQERFKATGPGGCGNVDTPTRKSPRPSGVDAVGFAARRPLWPGRGTSSRARYPRRAFSDRSEPKRKENHPEWVC